MARRYRILIAAAGLLLLPVVLCTAVLVFANTDRGRRLIESSTARLTHGGVVLQGLAGRFPDQLRLARLQLSDPQGQWLEADELQLNWWPLPLIRRHARVDLLQAARVHIERAPDYPARNPPSPSSGLWLRRLRVDKLDIQRLELGAPLAGNAVALRLQGGASITSWQQASGQLTAQRLDEVPATYRVLLHVDSARVRGQLDVEEDANGPLTHLIQLPDLGVLSAHLTLDGPRDAIDTRLTLHGGALQGSAAGSVNLNTRAAVLQVMLDATAMSPRPDLSWRSLSLRGSWSGTLAAPNTTAQLQLAGLIAGPLQLAALTADLHGEGDAVALDASLGGLVLPQPFLGILSASPLELHAQARLGDAARPVDFTLSHPLLGARGRWSNAGAGTLSLALKDIEPLAALAAVDLKGRGNLEAQLKTTGQSRRVDVSGELAVDGGDAALVHLLAPRAKVSATLVFSDNNFQIERSQLEASKLQLSVHGGDALGKLALDFKFALPDLAALSPALAGQLNAQGQLQGAAPVLTLDADVSGTLSLHGTTPGPVRLSLQAHDLPQRPNGRIDLTGTLDESPLHLTASVERDAAGTLATRIERGDWKSARLDGALRVDAKGVDPEGRLELHVARLEDLDRLLGQPIQGSLDASALFDRTAGGSRAHITVDAHDAGVPAQQLQLLQLRGDIIDPSVRPVLALQLTAQALLSGAVTKLAAELRGPIASPKLHAAASVQANGLPALQLDTSATLDVERRELRLTALRADYRQQTLRLLAPTLMSFDDGIAFEQLRLGMGDSTLQASGRLTPTLQLHGVLRDFTPAQLRVLWPDLQAEGRVDADVDLTGSLEHPQGLLRVQGRGLRASNGAARGLPSTDIDASAQLREQTAQVELQVHAGDGLQMQASGQVPLNRDAPIALKLSGNFNLNVINPIIEASGQRVLGAVKIDAELAGTPAAPQARGTLVLTGGDLEDYPRGTHLSDVSATLDADGEQLQLKQLTAHAGKGTISASGTVGLGSGSLPVALQLTAHGAKPFASDLLTATVDMDLKISGGLRSQLNASGSVQIDHADINIPNALPPDVVVLTVVRPGEKPAPVSKTPATIVMLNLTVTAPRAVFVRGRGLDAELGGQLRIGGSSADPDISGGFDLRNGTVNVAGATLTFSSGRVGFNGYGVKKKIDPTLDFAATNTSGGVTATLNVTGYADAPVISLSSTPEMPQDEILSRLLFGVSVTQLTPLQLAQIGAALATMGGVGGSSRFNPINAVQRKLGLDRLAIGGGSSNNGAATGTAGETSNAATIEAGRYVTRRVYIGAKQSTSGATQAQVQVDLTKSLKLQTTLGTGGGTVQGATPQNDPGSSVGLTYQFEY
ncbi:MAG TPA: translocation/assembly module TamB domain-containing protein [Steroidobacteraceae bacterium]|jgi:translocation and assembly module TamB|nr:translocation/assembly module TamB domain-containing protein [Steroidobacteraceae bacterium]